MPELPDIEIFKQYLKVTSLHKKIEKIEVENQSLLEGISVSRLEQNLLNSEFENATRHGKYLFAEVKGKGFLVLHFGMTGFLKYFNTPENKPEHTRLLIKFENGYYLAYSCQRKLGMIGWTKKEKEFNAEKELGPDPFENAFDEELFLEILKKRRGSIKSLLMNQAAIAGIGNIYSDEILFQSGIHPRTQLSELQEKDQKQLYNSLEKVLHTAVERRAGENGWPKSWLLPNREPGKRCPRCEGRIQQIKVSGRSAYYCSSHQKQG